MAAPDIAPQVIGGIYEVSDAVLGRGIIAGIKSSFTSGRIRRGDFDMNRSRNLLQQHLRQLPLEDQNFIRQKFDDARSAKAKLEQDNISPWRKFMLAMEYEKIAEYTFNIIERASHRAIDNGLMAQISEAAGHGAEPQPPSVGPQPPSAEPQQPSAETSTTASNPFTDSHAISALTDINVHNLEWVEMETYRSRITGEAAVVLDLHGRDATTQQVFATFSPDVLMGSERQGDLASIHSHALYGPQSEASDDTGR